MTHTDPRVVIKQIDPELRKEFFSTWPAFDKLDWSKLNKKKKVDSLLDCLKSQTDSDQREITYLLGLFSSLKSDDGLRILLEEIRVRNPDVVDGWGLAGSKIDKVVFAYLHAKDAFERAVIFEEADSCSRRQGWNTWAGVKCGKFNIDEAHISRFKKMLIGYHENEFRGKQCEINPYSRANGAEYIFAYLPNWLGNQMVFSDSKGLESLKLPMAFSILFVYTPKSGQFAMIASGGKKKQGDLRSIFYQALTDTSVDDQTPDRRAFEMDRILEDEFRFNQHDIAGVEKVEVASLAWSSNTEDADISWSSLRFRSGLKWKENLGILDRSLVGCGHDRSQIEIQSLLVRFYFTNKAHRALTIKITPQTCTIKSVKCEQRRTMMEQCVTQWGFEDE